MTFKQAFGQLKANLDKGKFVQMTPDQFEKMLEQFYKVGHKDGMSEGHKKGLAMAKLVQDKKSKDDPFSVFGGDMFGGR